MAAGYGLRPVQRGGAGYQTAGFIELPIDKGSYGTPIFNGDTVVYDVTNDNDTTGINVSNVLTGAAAIGVLMGARWVDSTGTPQWGQRYDGNAGNTEAMAFVAPNEGTIFKVQANVAWEQKYVGWANLLVAGAGGNVKTGNSSLTIALAAANGASATIVVVGPADASDTSTTPDVLVRWTAAGIGQQLG
jgi:hypothetical protein